MTSEGLDISHPDKCLFPEAGLTKKDTARYYKRVAGVLLPWAQDRPLTFKTYPSGIGEEGFFSKNIPDHFPESIRRIEVPLKSSEKTSALMAAAETAEDLVYFAGQNIIEIHALLAKAGSLDKPDQVILDLDPSDGDFDKVRTVARHCLSILDRIHLNCFLKLTGSKGLHLHIPIHPEAAFADIKPLARKLAESVQAGCPDLATLEKRKKNRRGKVFVDYLRNDTGQTAVLPYSLRARKGAPVATPIRRDELDAASIKPDRYSPENLFQRLGQMKDPWADFNRCRIGHARLSEAMDQVG